MKISKLFHWLYAILMLMPIFAIGVSCLYVIFNKNAKDSYSGETTYDITYRYQSNEVSSASDLIQQHIYYFGLSEVDTSNISGELEIYCLNNITIGDNATVDDIYIDDNVISPFTNVRLSFSGDGLNSFVFYNGFEISGNFVTLDNFIAQITYIDSDCANSIYSYVSYTDYNQLASVDIDTSGTLDNVFYYSIEQLKNNSLFNWSIDSFLAQPITYITDLFGMDNDNIVIYLLSYWLDISIIWLVFDLVMYVPLVIHRWIDKGVLE